MGQQFGRKYWTRGHNQVGGRATARVRGGGNNMDVGVRVCKCGGGVDLD